MKNKDCGRGGGGGGGLIERGGLINFPPLKRGGLFGKGRLNRGFTVISSCIYKFIMIRNFTHKGNMACLKLSFVVDVSSHVAQCKNYHK